MRRYIVVRAAWDDEAKVWYVEECEIPGVATEAESVEELRRKVPVVIRDLLEDEAERPSELEIDFITRPPDSRSRWTARSSHGTPPTRS